MKTCNAPTSVPSGTASRVRLRGRVAVGFSAEIWKVEIEIPNADAVTAACRISHRNYNHELTQRELASLRYLTALSDVACMPRFWEIGHRFGRLYVIGDLADRDCSILLPGPAPQPPAEHVCVVTGIVSNVAKALDTLHELGFVHGAMAPQHILLCETQPVLTGFSAFRLISEPARPSDRADLITWMCSAPEIRGGHGEPASDQFSLAVTYAILRTGVLPVKDPGWMDDSGYRELLAPNERRAVERAMAPLPCDRFTTCSEFAAELLQAVLKDGLMPEPQS